MTAPVLFEEVIHDDGRVVGVITLNAPSSLNALAGDMIVLITPMLRQWQQRDEVVAVWLEGSGERAFCAGGDVVEMYRHSRPMGERNPFLEEYFAAEYTLDYLIHTFPKPILAWGTGVVMGGGMGLMQGARFRIVTDSTRMAMPEITIGLYPDVGGSWFLQRTPGKTGLFVGLTGVHLNAADALFMNLADRHVPSAQRDALKQAFCTAPYQDDAEYNAGIIGNLLDNFATRPEKPSAVAEHLDTINDLCRDATLEQLVARWDAFETDQPWLTKALSGYRRGSVQTVRLVWEQLRRARHLSLADVFRMEWVMSVRCGMGTEFREGVRALLIDKDNAPDFRWKHIADIPPQELEHYFQSPASEHPLAQLEALTTA